jgi:hypothetical protein
MFDVAQQGAAECALEVSKFQNHQAPRQGKARQGKAIYYGLVDASRRHVACRVGVTACCACGGGGGHARPAAALMVCEPRRLRRRWACQRVCPTLCFISD